MLAGASVEPDLACASRASSVRYQLRASKGINKAPAVRLVQQTAPNGAVRVLATQAAPDCIAPRGSVLSLSPHGTILRVSSVRLI